jgi:heme exporter protein C
LQTTNSHPVQSVTVREKSAPWTRFASPQNFYHVAQRLAPVFGWIAILLAVAGLITGFLLAPTDFQQGDAYRIIFLHVPAAWMSMLTYMAMAFWAAIGLVFGTRLSFMMSAALAPTGTVFTVLALLTGSLWGKPTWGTWWVWDARLTSELILLFLYVGFIGLQNAFDDQRRADKMCAVLALVGVVNIPVIYFSVQWWNTLHQGASVSLTGAPSMARIMLTGMLLMSAAAWAYTIYVALVRMRVLILTREAHAQWLRDDIRRMK